MAFYEVLFPESIAFGAEGGPEFDTTITRTMSREFADGRRQYPLQRWDVGPGIKTPAQDGELLAFFMIMRGRLHRFRYRDRIDFTDSYGNGTGVVTGITSTTFQMVKRYTFGGQTLDRRIQKPVAEGLEVLISDEPTTAYTLDSTTGILTIPSAPSASAVRWKGVYHVPARFDIDYLPASTIARGPDGLIVQRTGVAIVEVPL